MPEHRFDPLIEDRGPRLDDQLCFPLYAASRLVTRLYQDSLEPLGITYPQYVVMMILWEDAPCSVKAVGERAILNSNTLTPLLKRLQQLGFIRRDRDEADERQVLISLTESGRALERQCQCVPENLLSGFSGDVDEAAQLKQMLDRLLPVLRNQLAER